MSEMANLMCHLEAVQLQYYSHGKSLSTTVKLSKPSIISAIVTESELVIEGTCLIEPLPGVQANT